MSRAREHTVTGELRRAALATLLGMALGILVRVFSRRKAEEKDARAWRGRSAI